MPEPKDVVAAFKKQGPITKEEWDSWEFVERNAFLRQYLKNWNWGDACMAFASQSWDELPGKITAALQEK